MSDDKVLYRIEDNIAIITLNRPQQRNALFDEALAMAKVIAQKPAFSLALAHYVALIDDPLSGPQSSTAVAA